MAIDARIRFHVKESATRQPVIVLEPIDAPLDVLAGGFLGFNLNAVSDMRRAEEVAALLNEAIESMSYTRP